MDNATIYCMCLHNRVLPEIKKVDYVPVGLGNDNYSKKVNMASMNPKLYQGFVDAKLHYQDMHNSLQLNNGNGTHDHQKTKSA